MHREVVSHIIGYYLSVGRGAGATAVNLISHGSDLVRDSVCDIGAGGSA